MISLQTFENIIKEQLNRDLSDNHPQRDAVRFNDFNPLLLAAGPGSGKTTVLVLRGLRHVFVDRILPENILITTFTKKAARELKTRWLEWGNSVLLHLINSNELESTHLDIDLNRCRIDTLDSVAQQTLTENRREGEAAPVILDESTSKLLFNKASFSAIYRDNQVELDRLFSKYTFDQSTPRNRGEALAIAKTLCDRLVQDLVDRNRYRSSGIAESRIVDLYETYVAKLQESNAFDFTALELELLERLQNKSLTSWTESISALLIDEYQDTNALQESIYFEVIQNAKPKVTVVGDDDQALYRFRGGSVELFTNFKDRCQSTTGLQSHRIDLLQNYRSSGEIVEFYNKHITSDPSFSQARISPAKSEVISMRGPLEMPVLGLFRKDHNELARDLASTLRVLVNQRNLDLDKNGQNMRISLRQNGDLGDFVLLAHSVDEVKYDGYSGKAVKKFPGIFRQEMESQNLAIFNPRGRLLRNIASCQKLLGLLLLCLDPDSCRTDAVFPTKEARYFFRKWRQQASEFIDQDPLPADSGGLNYFVEQWATVSSGEPNQNFPSDWPVLELVFTLITWIPEFQTDPEHQVWLEAITRTISSAGAISQYGMNVHQANGDHDKRTRESVIRDALIPIAQNETRVVEEIMPSIPRNHLQLMTIHQAKGLEFPLVIVDVGSQFKINHPKQRFLRFPDTPSNVTIMEDDIEPFLSSGIRADREKLDRTFDDLIRLYYVAFSRPQSVLILIGCESCLKYGEIGPPPKKTIPNVALGWLRDETWPWRQSYEGRRRPVHVNPPFVWI